MQYRPLQKVAACIGCGCNDFRACEKRCSWLRVNYATGRGVCSNCAGWIPAFDSGKTLNQDRIPPNERSAEYDAEARLYAGHSNDFSWPESEAEHDDEYMAEEIYRSSTAENENAQVEKASKYACKYEEKALGGVVYGTYHFTDRSKITFGSNGYVGCETPQ